MQDVSPDGTSVEEIAAGYIKPNDLLSSFERLEIYNRQYWFRVIGAVSEDYPALSAVTRPRALRGAHPGLPERESLYLLHSS
jgi:hypothetical protein